jgi:hypothetical protein
MTDIKKQFIEIFNVKKDNFIAEAGYPSNNDECLQLELKCAVQTFTEIIQGLTDKIERLECKN